MKYVISLLLVLCFQGESFPQDRRSQMDKLAARINGYEKNATSVYLRTNKDIYVVGEDLWFTAFILEAQTFSFSTLDKTLYVQLQQQKNDSVAWQEMYPIVNGLSSGQVFLPETLPTGDYLLRAYTSHSFFYNQSYFYAVSRIRVVKDLQAIVQPPISKEEKREIQFGIFPEGGNLVAGVASRVAFKAVDRKGKPMDVKGALLKGGSLILTFRSSYAGMGSFEFKPELNTEYRIKIDNSDSLYTIPKIYASGIIMRLIKNDNGLVFKITSSTSEKKRIFLRLQVRGRVQSIATGVVTDSMEVKIPTESSPQGMAEVTLFDEQLRPLCERLVFLHPEKMVRITVDSIKEQYDSKEKVSFKIKTTFNGNPTSAALAICVYDKLFNDPRNTRDIVNYYHLSTQLRGAIYDPSYYFDNAHTNRLEALDLLLLTQGWRRYVWNEEILKEIRQKVLSDSLQALVTRAESEKGKPITLMIYSYNKSKVKVVVADQAGKFYLTPQNFAIGPRFFVKYFAQKTHAIISPNPFEKIKSTGNAQAIDVWDEKEIKNKKTDDSFLTGYLKYGIVLREVNITEKGRGIDKYFGYLDSIAKFEGNTDYVAKNYYLNPPCEHTDIKPIEGKKYVVLTSDELCYRHVPYSPDLFKEVIYHYPKYTEEELERKLRVKIVKGYFQSKEFYEPDYDKIDKAESDTRNTLLWKQVVTDKNGEAVLSFFCSDISSQFMGIIEGVGEDGLLGVGRFNFSVK